MTSDWTGREPGSPVSAFMVRKLVIRGRSWRSCASWASNGVLGFILSVLLHEAAHFGAFWLMEPRLESSTAARIIVWAAGPLVTIALIVSSTLLVARGRRIDAVTTPSPFRLLVGLGLTAGLRLVVALPSIALELRGGSPRGNFDEISIARALDSSVTLLVSLQVLVMLPCWILLGRHIPREQRALAMASIFGALFVAVPVVFVVGRWVGLPI